MKNRFASMVFALALTSFVAAAFAAPPATDSAVVEIVVAEVFADQAVAPLTTVPTCGDASPVLVSTALEVVIDEQEPKGYCNCNDDADCGSICGDRGGKCLVTIPCEEPTRYNGWCHCG